MFAFLGGPTQSVFYMDFNSVNDTTVFSLFAASIIIGIIGVIIALLFTFCRDPTDQEIQNDGILGIDGFRAARPPTPPRRRRPRVEIDDPWSGAKGYTILDLNDVDADDDDVLL